MQTLTHKTQAENEWKWCVEHNSDYFTSELVKPRDAYLMGYRCRPWKKRLAHKDRVENAWELIFETQPKGLIYVFSVTNVSPSHRMHTACDTIPDPEMTTLILKTRVENDWTKCFSRTGLNPAPAEHCKFGSFLNFLCRKFRQVDEIPCVYKLHEASVSTMQFRKYFTYRT